MVFRRGCRNRGSLQTADRESQGFNRRAIAV